MLKKMNKGFTLIEVLVAVVILAISLTALLASTQSTIRNSNRLLENNIASWLAHSTLTEIQLGTIASNPSHDPSQSILRTSLNRQWTIQIQFNATRTEHLYRVTITVLKDKQRYDELKGYYYARKD